MKVTLEGKVWVLDISRKNSLALDPIHGPFIGEVCSLRLEAELERIGGLCLHNIRNHKVLLTSNVYSCEKMGDEIKVTTTNGTVYRLLILSDGPSYRPQCDYHDGRVWESNFCRKH